MMDLSECPNLIEDWPQGSGFEPCEDCGHARNKHPFEGRQRMLCCVVLEAVFQSYDVPHTLL